MLLNEYLGVEFPLMQGGMAQIATGRFAADVSNAGALGIIAAGGRSAAQLKEEIATARSLTDKPFGVNVMLMAPDVDEIASMLAQEQISVITTGAGDPAKYIPMWKAAGSKVIPVVPSVALALRMQKSGASAVIAEGTESGGHVGELTTMALLPQTVQALDVPVIGAGGVASGCQLAAMFALGAIGAQIGTVLLVSEECPIHDNYKQALLDARDTGTTVTGRANGAPVRLLKNKMSKRYLELEKTGASRDEFEKLALGSLRRAVLDGDLDSGSFMAGQVSGQLKEIRPLRVILEELVLGCSATIRQLQASQG
ncbi:MAG: nitronate monooxygenase family protein [Coriobacteriales bacterium]|jgi:enoyl-[acyl-carrier protein] reductase II|nr:nitronate monooxygenase family protein [Coriobacteriales bacterium]